MAMTDSVIHVAIVDDDAVIREGIARYLSRQKEFILSFAAASTEKLMACLKDHHPNILIQDIGLPGMSGIEAIRIVKEQFPEMDILVFTVHEDSPSIFEALKNGATAYLLKTTPFKELKRSLIDLYYGAAPMSPSVARKVIRFFNEPAKQKPSASSLTDKEKEVVQGLVDGLSYKMVADRLGVTIETVRSHIKKIYSKLHVNSKAQVITMSLRGKI
jgi:DNA-binding NarL/FixJ family response regulator